MLADGTGNSCQINVLKVGSVILGSSYQGDSSVQVLIFIITLFCFINDRQRGWNLIIDSWPLLLVELGRYLGINPITTAVLQHSS